MTEQSKSNCGLSPAARLALCVGVGAALSVSNNAATGIAVAAGLYLVLTLRSRRH
jgi:hypothetical protein